jgi:hypothetical protein
MKKQPVDIFDLWTIMDAAHNWANFLRFLHSSAPALHVQYKMQADEIDKIVTQLRGYQLIESPIQP